MAYRKFGPAEDDLLRAMGSYQMDRLTPVRSFPAVSADTYVPSDAGETMERLAPARSFSVGNEGADYSNVAGAGITAAGQTIGMLAQIAGNKAAMDVQADQSAAGRALSEKLAKLQLMQSANQANAANQASAYQNMLSALSSNIGSTLSQRELARSNSRNTAEAMGTAFLKRNQR